MLETIEAPPATETWFPLKHAHVLDTVSQTLTEAGFQLGNARLALSRSNARFFGTLDLTPDVAEGVHLTVGIRNSMDKSFPIAMCMGERVFVCDNLAFCSEVQVSKKHTRFARARFREQIARTMPQVHQYRQLACERIERLKQRSLSPDLANALILQTFEAGIVSSRALPKVIAEYRHPRYPQFEPRTAWSLLNAFTEVLKERLGQPAVHAALTMKLQAMLDSETLYANAV